MSKRPKSTKKNKKSKPPVQPYDWRWVLPVGLLFCSVALVVFKGLAIASAIYNAVAWLSPATQTQPNSMLATHFLSALQEISTSVPQLDALAIAPSKHSQYTVRRRQIDMIESLSFSATLVDDADVLKQVLIVKDQVHLIHQQTGAAEDAFKEAVAAIEKTTAFLLKELPLLNVHLQSAQLEPTLRHLDGIIQRISRLILELEQSTVPVAQLRVDMTSLVSNIGIMDSQLQYLVQRTNVGLVSQDRLNEQYRTAGWFTRLSRPDQQKYEQLVLLNRHLDTMQGSTRFLDETFERSEVQINVALDHLRGTNRRLTDIYTELGRTGTRIEQSRLEQLGEKTRFNPSELEALQQLGHETLRKITEIRARNEPILNAIMVYGYGAIDSQ